MPYCPAGCKSGVGGDEKRVERLPMGAGVCMEGRSSRICQMTGSGIKKWKRRGLFTVRAVCRKINPSGTGQEAMAS